MNSILNNNYTSLAIHKIRQNNRTHEEFIVRIIEALLFSAHSPLGLDGPVCALGTSCPPGVVVNMRLYSGASQFKFPRVLLVTCDARDALFWWHSVGWCWAANSCCFWLGL